MSLECHERLPSVPMDQDDLLGTPVSSSSGGIRSTEDPNLLRDRRVLLNLLTEPSRCEVNLAEAFVKVQTELKPHMRDIVTGWMLEVTEEQRCQPEVFCLAVHYLDRVLCALPVAKSQFQLLAAVCIFLASKFKESVPLAADKLVVYTDFSISLEEIMQWELLVLQTLNWDLSAVTPYCVLDLLLRLGQHNDNQDGESSSSFDAATLRRHSETFVALSTTEVSLATADGGASGGSAVLTACASLVAAACGLRRRPAQFEEAERMLETLSNISGIDRDEIARQAQRIEAVFQMRMPKTSSSLPTKQHPTTVSAVVQCNPSSSDASPANPPSASPTDVVDMSVACVY